MITEGVENFEDFKIGAWAAFYHVQLHCLERV